MKKCVNVTVDTERSVTLVSSEYNWTSCTTMSITCANETLLVGVTVLLYQMYSGSRLNVGPQRFQWGSGGNVTVISNTTMSIEYVPPWPGIGYSNQYGWAMKATCTAKFPCEGQVMTSEQDPRCFYDTQRGLCREIRTAGNCNEYDYTNCPRLICIVWSGTGSYDPKMCIPNLTAKGHYFALTTTLIGLNNSSVKSFHNGFHYLLYDNFQFGLVLSFILFVIFCVVPKVRRKQLQKSLVFKT
eukprot:PhF_6_TR3725/c0_g1_i3/m.5338